MAATLTTTMSGASADYIRYLHGTPQKTWQVDGTTLFDFALAPVDASFVLLRRGAYITFNTTTYPKWFTGYVTSEPERVYLGTDSNHQPTWGYKIQASSDDYILNLSPVGIIPTIVGKTMGYVVKLLANKLAPGVFDVTNVADGPILASYTIAPDKKFIDVVKDFMDAANFVFWANDKKLYFKAQDYVTETLLIDGDSKHFTPSDLKLNPTVNQVVNDVVVVGDTEPQAYVTEYITGDGFEAKFPLTAGVYGADRYVYLEENFTGNAFNAQNWVEYDDVNNWLSLYNGYLNVTGGSNNNSFDISLQSKTPIPLEGVLRLTHGEWDFISGVPTSTFQGVIGGLWTQQPNSAMTGVVFGIKYQRTALGAYVITPVVNGTEDASQSVTVDVSGNKRYVIRTIATFNRLHKDTQQFNYRDSAGAVQQLTGFDDSTDYGYYQTHISEIDATTGLLTNTWKWENENTVATYSYATYIPVASNNLHCTVSGISVSAPLQASLDRAKLVPYPNSNFDTWVNSTSPANWDFTNSASQETVDVVTGSALKLVSTTAPDFTAFCSRYASTPLVAGKKYLVTCSVKRSANFTSGLSIDLNDSTATVTPSAGLSVSYTSISSSAYTQVSGVLTTPLTGTLPPELILRVYITDNTLTPVGSYLLVDDVVIYEDWEGLIVGPNDLNSLDGLVTTATIDSTNNQPQTSSVTGSPSYNVGASTLVFFKDTGLQTTTTPQPNELYRLTYRASGNCYGRAVDIASIAGEAAAWGDTGVRSTVRDAITPRPRNSRECELAAAAIVGQDGYQHYDGTYTVWSLFTSTEPIPGTLVKFQNLNAALPPVIVEQITRVATTFESNRPTELFKHVVTFGTLDVVKKVLAAFSKDKGSFADYAANQQNKSQPIDINSVGLFYTDDVVEPILRAWDSKTLVLDCNQAPPSGGGFEIRTSDTLWGCDDGTNLVVRLIGGTQTFTIDRQDKTRSIFIRAYDSRNIVSYSEDQSQASYTTSGSPSYSMITATNPDGKQSATCSISLPSGAAIQGSSLSSVSTGYDIAGSVSIYASGSAVGKSFTIRLVVASGANVVASKVITLGAGWQRYTVSGNSSWTGTAYLQVINTAATTVDVYLTRFSIENNTLVETGYAKTKATPYGAVSRFASIVRVAFPPTDSIVATYDNSSLHIDTINTNTFITPTSPTVTLTATSVITPDAAIKSITSASVITLSTVPVINGGVDGQRLTLLNVGANDITLQCATTLAGSTVITTSDLVIGPNDMKDLLYITGIGWIQAAASSGAVAGVAY